MRKFVFFTLLTALLLPASAARAESDPESAMAQHIGRELKDSGQLRNYRIGIEFQDGVARLSGTVTSEEQRDAAVRLARQVQGVSHVVCKLSCPSGVPETAAAPNAFPAFNEAELASAQSEQSNVVQAYGNEMPAAAPMGPSPRPMAASHRPSSRRSPSRGNMPLPSHFAAGAGSPGVRQASAQGAYETPAAYPEGCAPGAMGGGMAGPGGGPVPAGFVPHGHGRGPSYENAQMPGYAWPSYASYPNYAALTYPKQYSPTAWPYIGPFYPYPQVPLAWRKVSLEWDDGWWMLDFSAHNSSH
jgi:BON domain